MKISSKQTTDWKVIILGAGMTSGLWLCYSKEPFVAELECGLVRWWLFISDFKWNCMASLFRVVWHVSIERDLSWIPNLPSLWKVMLWVAGSGMSNTRSRARDVDLHMCMEAHWSKCVVCGMGEGERKSGVNHRLRRPRISSPLRPFFLVVGIYDWGICEDTYQGRGWRENIL